MTTIIKYVERENVVLGNHNIKEVSIEDMTVEMAVSFMYNLYVVKKVKGCPFGEPSIYTDDNGNKVIEFDYVDTRNPDRASRATKSFDMFNL